LRLGYYYSLAVSHSEVKLGGPNSVQNMQIEETASQRNTTYGFKMFGQSRLNDLFLYLNSENFTGTTWFQIWSQVYFALQLPSVRFILNVQLPPSSFPHFM